MMFIFKKILTSLVLPPGFFILIFLGAGCFLIRRNRVLAWLLITSGFLLYLLSTEIVSDSFRAKLERGGSSNQSDYGGDVIIVLGGGVDENYRLDGEVMAGVSPAFVQRIMCGYFLWKPRQIPVIVSGGTPYQGGVAEAVAAKRLLTEIGVPAGMVIEETRSQDTRENVQYSKMIMEGRRFQKALVVTSPFHALRAGLLFERAGVNHSIYRCGATGASRRASLYGYLPNPDNLGWSAAAIKEYLGMAVYHVMAR
jgi:uncharacterized SAM-binding protein YcdF (DUF218 family)